MVWFSLDSNLAMAGSHFQNGARSPLEWDQMILGSLLQPAIALYALFLPSVLSFA